MVKFSISTHTVSSVVSGLLHTTAHNGSLNATALASAVAAHIGSPSTILESNGVPVSRPTLFLGLVIESIVLFSDALAEQSELSEAQNLRWDRFGLLAAYAFSMYGISTFFVALILNRTTVIASLASARARHTNARGILAIFRNLPVSQGVMLGLLRLLAVVLLMSQASNVLVALNVLGQNLDSAQTSTLSRWIPLHYFQYDPSVYAESKYMKMPRLEVRFGPTTAMFWPVFLSVSYSLFVETFAAAITNLKPFLEGGLSLFELSLAMQEMSSGFFFLRKYSIAKRPTEQVLLISLFLLADQISNQVGAVLYKNKYRLVPLTIISSMFVWYFCTLFGTGTLGIFALPLSIVVTYTALVLMLAITAVCAVIFVLTVVTKGARIDELNFANFFAEDHANTDFFARYLSLDLSQDFYTAAVNLGMVAVTQAGKSSYFLAYNYVPSPRDTWLEQSLWERVTSCGSTLLLVSDIEQTDKIVHFLTENEISGYNNIISRPLKRLINGTDYDAQPTLEAGTAKLRRAFLLEAYLRFFQLLHWYFFQIFYYWPKQIIFGGRSSRFSQVENDKQFEERRAAAPRFIRHLLSKNDMNVPGAWTHGLYVEGTSAVNQMARDALEEDDSPDFDIADDASGGSGSDSDSDSDAEASDISQSASVSRSLRGARQDLNQAFSSAIQELMTPETVMELLDDKEILHQHLHYKYSEKGMMTRSRYRAVIVDKSETDRTAALLDLILLKRKTQLMNEANKTAADGNNDDGVADDVDIYEIDPRVACVICQTEPRTLITWPCKCFAICEGCRVSLVAKGMKGCVCCRQDVEGVSRIYLP